MPVTAKIAKHAANPWKSQKLDTNEDLLPYTKSRKSKGVIQCCVLPEEYLNNPHHAINKWASLGSASRIQLTPLPNATTRGYLVPHYLSA
ncbi:hypothetical protein BU23DRAFT_553571 [Bimuria novae-zelandiae CBS 107.79]|uniref:Uncharacterized protein n=1 Tax=Bimuria novae-zelandiae CBS 107.79 TaxID=1447943 RepID=A0A6A5V9V0_9PLEO|nr:hypothetical protein BU23DRAFT_553571 [Bimuria novae-zelandiae CBS 107.79]